MIEFDFKFCDKASQFAKGGNWLRVSQNATVTQFIDNEKLKGDVTLVNFRNLKVIPNGKPLISEYESIEQWNEF